jgi:hypothetical protein
VTSFNNWSTGNAAQPNPADNALINQGPTPIFRNAKDARLASYGASPDTQHPDGYLGTIINRRQDKIMGAVARNNQRSYSRGVHKGERVNPGDYLWPDEFNLLTGLKLESQGKKFAPPGAEPVRLTNDGKAGPRGVPRGLDREQYEQIDLQRQSMLKSLAPSWR